jgi:uncharacterized surface protein with fasciclin (FAS1) repeats
MKKNLRILGLSMLSVLAIAFTSCNKDDSSAEKNILQTIQAEAQFSTLAKALRVTGLESTLTGATKYTLFAPTNAAFAELEITSTSLDLLTPAELESLKNILLNHVVNDAKLSSSLATGYVKTNAKFGTTTSKISMYINVTGTTTLNGNLISSSSSLGNLSGNATITVGNTINYTGIITGNITNLTFSGGNANSCYTIFLTGAFNIKATVASNGYYDITTSGGLTGAGITGTTKIIKIITDSNINYFVSIMGYSKI